MKKHVLGVVFFACIVVFSAFVFGLIGYFSIQKIEVVSVPLPEDSKEVCFPESTDEKVRVIQAIVTPSERSLVLDLGRSRSKQTGRVMLVFHTVNEQGTSFVRSETIDILANAGVAKYTFEWLKDVRDSDNHYISVRPTLSGKDHLGDLQFSKKDATAILIAKK